MKRHRLFSSTAIKKVPSGEAARRQMLEEELTGRVIVWCLLRSVTEIRLPTGEMS